MQLGLKDAVYFTGGLRSDRSGGIGLWAVVAGRSGGRVPIKPRIAQSIIVPSDRQVAGEESERSILLANPDLRAQRQRGYDMGVDFLYRDKGSIGLTFFDQDPIDLIELVITGSDFSGPFPRSIFQYQNLHRVNNQGWEVKFEAQPVPQLALNVNYGRTKSTVLELDESYVGDFRPNAEGATPAARWVPA